MHPKQSMCTEMIFPVSARPFSGANALLTCSFLTQQKLAASGKGCLSLLPQVIMFKRAQRSGALVPSARPPGCAYMLPLNSNWKRLLVILAPLCPEKTNILSWHTATGKLQQDGGISPLCSIYGGETEKDSYKVPQYHHILPYRNSVCFHGQLNHHASTYLDTMQTRSQSTPAFQPRAIDQNNVYCCSQHIYAITCAASNSIFERSSHFPTSKMNSNEVKPPPSTLVPGPVD